MRISKLLCGAMFACAMLPAAAHADLVYMGEVDLGGQGFGNAPRLLTIQGKGNATTESGVVGIKNGDIAKPPAVSGITDGQSLTGNGVTNVGGDEVNPFVADGNKFSIPTLSSLTWNDASDVKIVFNATEPGGNGLDITDLTLKFYSGDTVIQAVDGQQSFANTIPGNGSSGFLFGLDDAQAAIINATVFQMAGSENFRIALEATINGVAGGPESFLAVQGVAGAIPEPATWAMMLLGFFSLGFAARRKNALQTA